MKNILFHTIRDLMVKPWLKVYFHDITYRGLENLRPDAPVLYVSNHQNAFVDAFLPIAKDPRPIWSLTRGDIFENPRMAKILDSMCLIPIYRKRDGAGFQDKTMLTFQRVKQLFREDRSHVLIFGEGNAKAESRLRPLTSGFARLAFDVASDEKEGQKDLLVQPVSVQYEQHTVFRRKAVVTIHPAISMFDWMPIYKEEPRKAIVELKKKMTEVIKSGLISPPANDSHTPEEHMQMIANHAQQEGWDFGKDFQRIKNWHEQLIERPAPEKKVLLATAQQNTELVQNRQPRTKKQGRWARVLGWSLLAWPSLLLLPSFLIAEKPVKNFKDPQFFTSVRYATGMFTYKLLQFLAIILLAIFTHPLIALAWLLILPLTNRAALQLTDHIIDALWSRLARRG